MDEDDCCPFCFNVFWDTSQQRWYLPKEQRGNPNHAGHIRRTPDIAPARALDLPLDEQKLACDLNESNVPLSTMDNIIFSRNNLSLSQGKLEYLRTKQREVELDRALSSDFGADPILHPKTAADRLLAHFDTDETSKYVALFGEYDSGRLTIKKKRKHKKDYKIESVEDKEISDDVTDAQLEASKMETSIRDSLKVTSREGKILLALAWTDDESQLRFQMFPDLMGSDVTNKINREERPLGVYTGLDSRNQSFSHTWVFLPQESKWALNWVKSSALRCLHSQDTLDKVRILLTDQDGQLGFVADHNTGKAGTVLPNAKHRLCAWHKLDRNLTNSTRFRGAVASNQHDDLSAAEWNALVSWLWMLYRNTETEYESNLLLALLDFYLESEHSGSEEGSTPLRGYLTPELTLCSATLLPLLS
jgi:hypothetical protein